MVGIDAVRFEPLFEPRDFFVGVYIGDLIFLGGRRYRRSLYFLLLPMLGIKATIYWETHGEK